ncbi:hypothetical protein [Curtobacterium sp. B8]|uniref:hypothetical protein n=1 Tax=Curtobacterium sp. B8 TaxID=95611 RepID=UPI0003467BA1|nr:hypothetical protein [Curtobacterium sp. B8]
MTTGARRSRPALVTAAVVLWLVVCAVQLVGQALMIGRTAALYGPWFVVVYVVGFGLIGFVVFGAVRLARGSGRARFWLAVLAALGLLGAVVPPYGLTTAERVAAALAGVLPYLPPARAWFPPRPARAPKAQQPRVVGWDPDTGEPVRASE